MSDLPWLEIAEPDYAFGAGVLRIRVDRILGWFIEDRAKWARVEGVEYSWNGTVLHPHRVVAIRGDALVAAGYFA